MKSIWTKSALAAAALMCVGAANAAVSSVISFDEHNGAIDNTYAQFVFNDGTTLSGFTGHGDEIHQNGYYAGWYSNAAEALPGDFVGGMVDGATNVQCGSMACPGGNNSVYGAALNDGVIEIGTLSGTTFSIQSFKASFIGNGQDLLSSRPGVIQLQGFSATGASLGYQQFSLTGVSGMNGSLSFATYTVDAGFQTAQFAGMTAAAFFAYACDANNANCGAFQSDKAQFAIDDIAVTANIAAVPEPSQWLLMGAGLAALGAIVRRRRSSSNAAAA